MHEGERSHIARRAAPAAAALAAAALLVTARGLLALRGDIDFLCTIDGLYMGWMAKALLNGFVSDPFMLQYTHYQGGSVILSLLLVPIFHFLGDSLFHLVLSTLVWQAAIMALLVALCWRAWGPASALWAGLLLLCAPLPYLQYSMFAIADHSEIPLFGLINALLLWRIFRDLEAMEDERLYTWALLGLVNGLGLYFSYGHLTVLAADGLVLFPLLLRGRMRPGRVGIAFALAAAGLCVGLTPWFYHLARYTESIRQVMITSGGEASLEGSLFGILLTRFESLGNAVRTAMTMDVSRYIDSVFLRRFGPALGIGPRAVFLIFPVVTTATFIALTLSGLRRRFSASRGIEAWCTLYLLVHLTACWAYGAELPFRYIFPLFPVLCAMGGAVSSRASGLRPRALRWAVQTSKAALAMVIIGLALVQWNLACTGPSRGKGKSLEYRGFSDRAIPSLFADPIARTKNTRHRLRSHTLHPQLQLFFNLASVEAGMASWEALSMNPPDGEEDLERFWPIVFFNMGETAGLADLGIESLRRDLGPVVPKRYRHFLYMGYSYFLRMGGVEVTSDALESLEKVEPRYRHYFLISYGACLGMKYRRAPGEIRRALSGRAGRDLGYVAAGVLGTPASLDRELDVFLVEALPEPVRSVIECRLPGSCSSPFGRGVRAAENSVDWDTGRVDWMEIAEGLEGSTLPGASGYGAGAALAFFHPWIRPSSRGDLETLPESIRDDFERGRLESTSWLFGGDMAPFQPRADFIRGKQQG